MIMVKKTIIPDESTPLAAPVAAPVVLSREVLFLPGEAVSLETVTEKAGIQLQDGQTLCSDDLALVDSSKAATYEITLYCKDENGKKSASVSLTIIIQ